jgi:DNA helicase II / ATP-dependent DNA helicase PcrA
MVNKEFSQCLETDLNPEQRRAVETLDGPVLVLAGAGSGKTRVIAYRTANLVFTETIPPYQILAVTFTNKAADEMRTRIHAMVGIRGHDIALGTFHRICAQILRRYGTEIGVPTDFAILDDTESMILIKRCQKAIGIDPQHYDHRAIAGAISNAKSKLIGWRAFQEQATDRWDNIVGEVYEKYEEGLVHAKSLDFDDLIMKTVELMEASPKALGRLQDKYRYILVDEYQDINKAQYVFTKKLAERDHNICVVGDDDQSIYAFRGANPKYILNFEEDFPGAAVIKLEENYRSIPGVLKVANALVSGNAKRHHKNLWTKRPDGEPVTFKYNLSDEAEAVFVAETVEMLQKAEKRNYNDFAVLYRTNSLSRLFEEVFTQYAIPYKVIGGFRFYERKEVRDVLAYLKLVQNPWDTVSLQRIINTPSRGIGEKSFTILLQVLTEFNLGVHELANREEIWPALGGYAGPRIVRFCEMIRTLHEEKESFSVFELTGRILDETGYVKRLEESDTIEAEGRLENIEELQGAITNFDEAYPTEGLPVFLEQVALIQATDQLSADVDSVKCLTAHSAKGLEFPVVFLVGLEEGLFPHSRSNQDPHGTEEERRLAYVGITRAMDRLYLSAAHHRSSSMWKTHGALGGARPSRFLSEIPPQLIEPADADSARALIGDLERQAAYEPQVKDRVSNEYNEYGDGWTVLPRAYKWQSEQPGGSGAGAGFRPKGGTPVKKAVDDTPRRPSKYSVGQTVEHPTFGVGKIIKIQSVGGGDYFLQINFQKEGPKLLSEEKAPLTMVEEG